MATKANWDEAARIAADSVFDWYDDPDEEHRVTPEFALPILQKKILDDFADLRSTYEKMVELLKELSDYNGYYNDEGQWRDVPPPVVDKADTILREIGEVE